MKTCSKCNTSMPDDVKFCIECGNKMEMPQQAQTKKCVSCKAVIPTEADYCPECGAKQVVEEKRKTVDLYESVNNPEINIQCGYGYNSPNTVVGSVTISPTGILFESNAKGITGVLSAIATLGQKTRMGILFKDIEYIGVRQKGYLLYIRTKDGTDHVFSGPSVLALDANKNCVKKIAYLVELYRRMYWYYGEYKQEVYLSVAVPVGYFEDAVIRVDNLSDAKLINFYHTLY